METVRVVCQIKKGFIYFLLFKKKKIMDAVFFGPGVEGPFLLVISLKLKS